MSFISHVIKSGIPLLWSRPSMARVGVVLDLLEDQAEILRKEVDLELTTAGHYICAIHYAKGYGDGGTEFINYSHR